MGVLLLGVRTPVVLARAEVEERVVLFLVVVLLEVPGFLVVAMMSFWYERVPRGEC
jgi:hypothetical protein